MPEQSKIVLNKLASDRRIEDKYILAMEKAARKLERMLIESITKGNIINTADIAISRANVEKLLVDSGYYKAVEDLLSDGYQQAVNTSYTMYNQMLDQSLQLGEISIQRIEALKALDFNQFNNLGQQAVDKMTRVLTDLQFGATNFNNAVSALQNTIIDPLTHNAKTLITTGLSGMQTVANTSLAEDAGIEKFEYIGPADSVTRPFCLKHIGQVKTMKEWSNLSNDQGLPVNIYLGGYNCRHQLVGVG